MSQITRESILEGAKRLFNNRLIPPVIIVSPNATCMYCRQNLLKTPGKTAITQFEHKECREVQSETK